VTLLVAEAFAASFGILGLGGVVALVLGAGMLVDERDAAWLQLSLPMVAAIGLTALALRNRGLRSHSGTQALVGERARVLDWSASSNEGHVLLAGERWRARGPAVLRPGQPVRALAVQGLQVQVSTAEPEPPLSSPTA